MYIQNQRIRNHLNEIAPNVGFTIYYQQDPGFGWDGDGPDPRDEGYEAYDVDVMAATIHMGNMYQGKSSLGGVFEKVLPETWDPDVGGYLPQLLCDAIDNLLRYKTLPKKVISQLKKAKAWLEDQ